MPRRDEEPDRIRMLPASPDAEKGLICSILIAPKDVCAMCIERGVTVDWFHSPAREQTFRVLMRMHDKREKGIDLVTLTQELHDLGVLEQIGGASEVSELFTYLPTATNASYYIDILEEKHTLREIIRIGTTYSSRAYDDQSEAWQIKEEIQEAAMRLGEGKKRAKFTTSREAVMAAVGIIQDMYERRGSISGIATGFLDFDKLTNGLQRGEMIVVAARPSHGKTAFAMNIAEHVAVEQKRPVGVFSLEMTTTQLVTRMLCSRAKVNLARVRDGFLADRDFPSITAAAGQIAEARIIYDDCSDLTIQELRARARRMKLEHGIEILFVDYIQLVRSSSKKSADNREREVAEVSAGLKGCAKELDIPVVVLAQIARKFEERGATARPRLSDLRESGAIEQDADLVAFLVRAELSADGEEEKERLCGIAELIVAKHRSGPLGDIALTFLKEFARFEARASTDDYEEVDSQQHFDLPP